MTETCASCRFFLPLNLSTPHYTTFGLCRRHPPTRAMDYDYTKEEKPAPICDEASSWRHPFLDGAEGWCGEFSKLTPQKKTIHIHVDRDGGMQVTQEGAP